MSFGPTSVAPGLMAAMVSLQSKVVLVALEEPPPTLLAVVLAVQVTPPVLLDWLVVP